MLNIFLVFLLFFLTSGPVRAEAQAQVPGASTAADATSGRLYDEADGNGTVAGSGQKQAGASGSSAGNQPDSAAPGDGVYAFDPVSVVGDRQEAGKAVIGGQELHSLPSHTGSITEAVKGFSNVQFSNDEISSLTGGEIRPPRVTISGAKPYENNFLIDGMSVSNTLDPSGLDADGDSVLPSQLGVGGADQTIFYDSSLIDTVTVYSSNVPVKYGNFVGGVVDAELIDPRTDRWHAVVKGRHARSEWFNMRGTDDDSTSSANQPRFRTSSMFASFDGPVSDDLALLFAASKQSSVIPLLLKENDGSFSGKDQYRSNENYFAKMRYVPSRDVELNFDITYAPYVEERWRPAWPASDWRVENKAIRVGGTAVFGTDWGELTAKAAWSQNGYSRDSANNYRRQVSGTGIPKEEQIFEGGVGDATTLNRSFDASLFLDFDSIATKEILWRVSTGLDISTVTTDMWNEDAKVETLVVSKPSKANTPPTWVLTQTDYFEYDQTKTLNTLGWYVQTETQWGRFTLIPGLRLDYDDYSFNANLAPRLKAELDAMGDGVLRFVAGASRYYGGQLRAYAFDRHRPSHSTVTRSTGTVNYSVGTDRSYLAKDLDTPYSDEITGGIQGHMFGFEYGIELVRREHRDQLISKSTGNNLYEMTNDGRSTYDGLTLSLARAFETERLGAHSFRLGVTKSRSKTFNGAYNSDVRLDLLGNKFPYDYDRVYYDGEIMDRSGMPADNYNAPVVVALSWMCSFFDDHFRVNSISRWRDSTTGLVQDSRLTDETPYGTTSGSSKTPSSQWLSPGRQEYYDAYKKGVISGGVVTDVSLEFDAVKEELFTLTFLLDVTNVFSSAGHTGVAQKDGFQDRTRGRGYYAGIRCEF